MIWAYVKCMYVCVLVEDGRLFMWGDNSVGQISFGDEGFAAEPREVHVGEAVIWVSCGYKHSAFVTGTTQSSHMHHCSRSNVKWTSLQYLCHLLCWICPSLWSSLHVWWECEWKTRSSGGAAGQSQNSSAGAGSPGSCHPSVLWRRAHSGPHRYANNLLFLKKSIKHLWKELVKQRWKRYSGL